MMTQGMTMEAMAAVVIKANKTYTQFSSEPDNF